MIAVPVPSLASSDADSDRPADVDEADDSATALAVAKAWNHRVLDRSQLSETTEVYARSDGSWTAVESLDPVRVKDEAGVWRDVDLTLVDDNGVVAPKVAPVDVTFSDGGDKVFAQLSEDGKDLAWRWPTVLPAPILDGATATYVDAVPDGDLVVTATATGFSHSIVLRQRPSSLDALAAALESDGTVGTSVPPSTTLSADPSADLSTGSASSADVEDADPTQDRSSEPSGGAVEVPVDPVQFSIPVSTDGATLTETAAGGLKVADGAREVVATAPQPMMWDAATNAQGQPANMVPVETTVTAAGQETPEGTTAGASPVLTLTPDQEFLADPDTRFPVTIDPTYSTRASADTYIDNSHATTNYSTQPYLIVGTPNNGTTKYRSYVQFPNTGNPWFGKTVTDASLTMTNYTALTCSGSNVAVAQITTSWNAGTLTWSGTQPGFTTANIALSNVAKGYSASCPAGNVSWDVTGIVRSWAAGATMYGFRVTAQSETGTGTYRGYRSKEIAQTTARPLLSVTYNDSPVISSLSVDPCVRPDATSPCSSPLTADSFSPELTAVISDSDPTPIDATFVVRASGTTDVVASGTTTVTPSPTGVTARFQVADGILAPNGSYEFQVSADDGVDPAVSGWTTFKVKNDLSPDAPTGLSVEPCAGACTGPLVSASLTPDLTAVVSDPDSASLDAMFEVRAQGSSTVIASGSDLVSSGDTARFSVPAQTDAGDPVLSDGQAYEFRVTASDAHTPVASGWVPFTVAVDPNLPTALELAEPLTVYDTGADLRWTPYHDPTTKAGDDLAEYQVFRRCVTLPDGGCPSGATGTFDPDDADIELVDPDHLVGKDQTAFTDTTATPSTASMPATYYYWVGARTKDDVAHNRRAQVATDAQLVTTPRDGRVRRILTGADPSGDDGVDQGTYDTTVGQSTPNAVLAEPSDGTTTGAWIQAGTGHPTYGTERALLRFDTTPIDPHLTVTDARLELHQVGGGGAGTASFELRGLTKGFVEDRATWNDASSTIEWTSGGGDLAAAPAATLSTDAGAKTLNLTGVGSGAEVRTAVQGWVDDPATNHGVALKATTESGSPGTHWLNIASAEAQDLSTRPRLVVEHLRTAPKDTISAPELPERFEPNTVTPVQVRVINTTASTWPATLQLSYRWALSGQTADQTSFTDDRFKALGAALAPGESVTVTLSLRSPSVDSAETVPVHRDLFLDLKNGTSTSVWWSTTNPYGARGQLDDTERTERVCTVVNINPDTPSTRIGGLLCPERVIFEAGSTDLGLEQFYSYTGQQTGGGGQLLTNLFNGNLLWSYDAFANPSVGPSMFARVTYNSQDKDTNTASGNNDTAMGWSVQAGTLNRLGTELQPTANDTVVTLVDGDGTTHTWRKDEDNSSGQRFNYIRPPGIALDLVRTGNPTNTAIPWVFTRPDGTRFFFDNTNRASTVVDRNGNTMTFGYDPANPLRLTTVTDAKGRQVGTLTWTSTGKLSTISDISGRTLTFHISTDNQLTSLDDTGTANDASGSCARAAMTKTFAFTYTTATNSGVLASVGDPKPGNAATSIGYYTSTDTYPPANTVPVPSWVNGWAKIITDRMGRQTVLRYAAADGEPDHYIAADVEALGAAANPADNETTSYVVDGFGRTVELTDAENHTTTMGWDADHNVTRLTQPGSGNSPGAIWRWIYDPVTGYPLKIWDAEVVRNGGDPQILTYDDVPDVPGATVLASIRTPAGHLTTFGHNDVGDLTSVTDPNNHTTEYSYDLLDGTPGDGTVQSTIDANGHKTTFDYAPTGGENDLRSGYPTTITPPASIKPTTIVYDERGNVRQSSQTDDATTLLTTADYDGFGRPVCVTTPGSQSGPRVSQTAYDLNDNVTATTAPNGAATTSTYFDDDQVKDQILPANAAGAPDRKQTWAYDAMGRLHETVSPLGNQTPTANDRTTRYTYDHLGQVTSMIVPLSGANGEDATTTYGYDTVGNLTSVTDPNNNTTTTTYDAAGRPTATVDAARFVSRTRYDADGRVIAQTDQAGNTTSYAYDDAGQLVTKSLKHTPTGQLSQTWVTRYDYDAVGNPVKTIRPYVADPAHPDAVPAGALFTTNVFDDNNQLTEQHGAFDADNGYPSAAVTYTEHDGFGRLTRQSAPSWDTTPPWTDFDYYDSGEIKTSTDPFGISTTYKYNPLGLQTSRVLTGDGGSPQRTMTWAYNADGSLAARDDEGSPTVVKVDNTDTTAGNKATIVGSSWSTGTSADPKVGEDYRTHPAGSPTSGDNVTWTLTPPEAGTFRVDASCPKVAGTASAASYTITATSGTSTTTRTAALDQSACDGEKIWYSLGTSAGNAATAITVKLVPNASGTVVADAIRLVQLDTERAFTYSYNPDGQTTEVHDNTPAARFDEYTSDYDAVGRLELATELANGTPRRSTGYTYDLAGNLRTIIADRPDDPGTGDSGNLATSTYTAYCWDARNQISTVTAGKSATGQLRRWKYTYDPTGKIATLTKPDGVLPGTVTPDSCDPGDDPDGNKTTYSYFESGLLRSSIERTPAGDLVASHQLTFNPDGDRTRDASRIDNAGTSGYLDQTANYAYTPARQLASVTKTGSDKSKNETYAYDAAGNVTTQNVGGKATTFTYTNNRLITSTTSGLTSTNNYDGLGRLKSISTPSTPTSLVSYSYDGFDRLTHETRTAGSTTVLDKATVFDAFDRPFVQTVTAGQAAAKKTRYTYLGQTNQVAVEEQKGVDGIWQAAKTYNYAPDGRPLVLANTPVDTGSGADPASTQLYGYNPHGDTETLTDPSSGHTTATYRYTGYGTTEKNGSTGLDKDTVDPGGAQVVTDVVNPYRFNAKRYDPTSGKYDMGFRTYDPGLNRFLTRDMYNGALNDLALGADPWNTNRYAFAGGNPISRVELNGHTTITGGGGDPAPAPLKQPGPLDGLLYPSEPRVDSNADRIGEASSSGSSPGFVVGGFSATIAEEETSLKIASRGLLGRTLGGLGLLLSLGGDSPQNNGRSVNTKTQSRACMDKMVQSGASIYYYPLDGQGRATGAVACIRGSFKGFEDLRDPPTPVGWDPSLGLNRSHLIARRFGGGSIPENIVALYANANQRGMAVVERTIDRALRAGETVYYASMPLYNPRSVMPIGVNMVWVGSGGTTGDQYIPNVP